MLNVQLAECVRDFQFGDKILFFESRRYVSRLSKSGEVRLVKEEGSETWIPIENIGRMTVTRGTFEKHFVIYETVTVNDYEEARKITV